MLRNKYNYKDYLNNIIVVTYCNNQEKAAAYMLEALNKQNYSKMNYQFHFILDNCTDNTANMLEFIGGAKLWKVGDGVTLGKDESISWLLERLIHVQNTDAFVFIDVERQINDDFLENINKSLMVNDVIVGENAGKKTPFPGLGVVEYARVFMVPFKFADFHTRSFHDRKTFSRVLM